MSQRPPARRRPTPPFRRRSRPARGFHDLWAIPAAFVVAVAGAGVVYALNPTNGVGLAAYTAVSFGVAAAVGFGIRRYRPPSRTGWRLLALGPPLGSVGTVLRPLLAGHSGLVALLPDAVTISAYLVFSAALFSFLRARRGGGADSALDGGLMAVAALLVSWSMLIAPVLSESQQSISLKVINSAYPTISVTNFFLVALLAMTEMRAVFAFWAIATGWLGLVSGDLVYALASVGTQTVPLWVANSGYLACYALLGAAGLHPSMVSLGRPGPPRVRGYSGTRLIAVAVALLAPAAVVGLRPPDSVAGQAIAGGLVGLLGILVLVRSAGAVNRHATSEQRLLEQANADRLTGLPNRLRLTSDLGEALASARAAGEGIGVLFIDLDEFKTVNDNWGHETGDELLTVVARRLANAVRAGELLARVGGDEFVVVCRHIEADADAVEAALRLLAELDDPVTLGSASIEITASAGVAVARPAARDASVEDLLREADTAMYRAKARGGGAVVAFDASMRTEILARIALERSLRGALDRAELRLHYQPIVDLRTGATIGFEALMRWQHPTQGLLPPDSFIPVAEATGLIVGFGRWAIEVATAQLAQWRRDFGPLTMSVNISARQIHDPHLIETVRHALRDNGLPGPSLCLEVTETTLMDEVESTTVTIEALKRLGIRLSADDFGTGYSSLAYLRRYPFDEVKVDCSFVGGLGQGGDDDVIVGAVLSMAASLSMGTVAEGVETAEQRDRLLSLGASNAQGWLYSPALTAAQATASLAGVPRPRPGAAEPVGPLPQARSR